MNNTALEHYCIANSGAEDELLKELRRQTHLKMLMPRMLSGEIQGKFLSMISTMLQPRKILEIGTFTGYSALCLAAGLQNDGQLITIEKDDELEPFIRHFFDRSAYAARFDLRIGDALEIIPQLDNDFDLVFLDADKPAYPAYFDLLKNKIRRGGYMITDNVLWGGKVLDNPQNYDIYTEGIALFNQKINSDPTFDNLLLPLRDGLMLAEKL